MSQNPYSDQSFGQSGFSGSPLPSPTAQRPTSAVVFGVLHIAFGVLGLCGVAASLASMGLGAANNPAMEVMRENKAYSALMIVSIGLNTVFTAMLLAAGPGLLAMKNWGRTVSIAYGVLKIVETVISTVLSLTVVAPALVEKANTMPDGPEKLGLTMGAYGGAIGGCFGLIYPVVVLIFMYRPALVSAFEARKGK